MLSQFEIHLCEQYSCLDEESELRQILPSPHPGWDQRGPLNHVAVMDCFFLINFRPSCSISLWLCGLQPIENVIKLIMFTLSSVGRSPVQLKCISTLSPLFIPGSCLLIVIEDGRGFFSLSPASSRATSVP